jgi:hypothetical protein
MDSFGRFYFEKYMLFTKNYGQDDASIILSAQEYHRFLAFHIPMKRFLTETPFDIEKKIFRISFGF